MQDMCFWSIGDGKYAAIVQALVNSFHQVGMEADFHVISDRPIKGAITHLVSTYDKTRFQFKIQFLMDIMRHLPYRYFIYLDADSYFVRKSFDWLSFMQNAPLHVFLETNLLSPHVKRYWWGPLSLQEYARLMREKGIRSEKIYNINGGFFIVAKDAIPTVYELMLDFWELGEKNHYKLSDEPPLAFAMHALTGTSEIHLIRNHTNTWAIDWRGVFQDTLPSDIEWNATDFYTYENYLVNPCIVHAFLSKEAMKKQGEDLWKIRE